MLTLAAVWGFALAGLGLFFPYYSLYLRENAGLRGLELGVVMAMLPLAGLIAQPFWGQVSDRTGRRGRILTALALGTAGGYAALALADGFLQFLLCTAALALFATALIPTCVAVSLALLPEPDRTAFGRVRVLGTIGFGISVLSFPWILHAAQARMPDLPSPAVAGGEPGLALAFVLASAMLLLAALASLRLPAGGAISTRAARGEWRTLLRSSAYMRVVLFSFLTFLFSQGAMVLFPILVRAQGGGLDAISRMWGVMLLLEIPLVFYFGAAVSRIGPRGVIAIGTIAAALRWLVSGFATDLSWIHAAQILHGVTVWGVILGVPVYVDAIVPPQLRSTGQGLLAMLGVSFGAFLSNLGAGWLSEAVGPKAPAQVAGVACLLLTLTLPWMLPAVTDKLPAVADKLPALTDKLPAPTDDGPELPG
jgi:MFS family permease